MQQVRGQGWGREGEGGGGRGGRREEGGEADSGGRRTEGASNISDEVGLTSPCCWAWQLFTKGERFATYNNAHQ